MINILRHLQNPVVNRNLLLSQKIKTVARNFLLQNGFSEYDTPVLIPKQGEKYNHTFDIMIAGQSVSLADSPQIYKLMLSMAGFEKYYQFAHCFRPVESESDIHKRLCEFVQLDIEMQIPTLFELTKFAESLITEICSAINTNPKIEYMEGIYCRKKYGNEMKPDLRKSTAETSVVFIERIPLTNGERTKGGTLIPCHHIFAMPSGDFTGAHKDIMENTSAESFDMVINGIEVGGGDLRIMSRELQEKVMDIFDVDKKGYANYLQMLDNYNGKQNGGFAFGLERLVMALSGCNDITQTVAFPDFYKMGSC